MPLSGVEGELKIRGGRRTLLKVRGGLPQLKV